jgi:outer membrane protein insertion porin family
VRTCLAAVVLASAPAVIHAQADPLPRAEPDAAADGLGAPIEELTFTGASWIPRERLQAILGLEPGAPYSPAGFAEAVARLLAWDRIATVRPRLTPRAGGGLALHLEVEAYLHIHAVTVAPGSAVPSRDLEPSGLNFGAEPFATGVFSFDEIGLAPGTLLEGGVLERARDELQGRYVRQGWLFATVEVEALELATPAGSAELVFDIQRGPRVSIRRIDFAGNRSFPDGTLGALLHHRPRSLFGLLQRGIYEPGRLSEDLDALDAYYRDHGFLDVQVFLDSWSVSDDLRHIDLGFRVFEGARFVLRGLDFEGHTPVLEPALRAQLRTRTGAFYDGAEIARDRARIERFYQERTLRIPEVRAEPRDYDLRTTPPSVSVVLVIDERRHYFTGLLRVRGNEFTRARVVRARAAVVPAGPVTPVELEQTARRVHASGLFRDVQVSWTEAPDRVSPNVSEPAASSLTEPGAVRDVTIDVAEQKTGFFELGGGASSGGGEIFTVRATQRNFDLFDVPGGERGWRRPFSGGGQLLQVEVNPGTRISEFGARFVEPYLYNSRNALTVEAYNEILQWRRFTEEHLRAEIGVRHYWDEERAFSTRLAWVIEDVDLDDVDPDIPAEIAEFDRHTLLSFASLELDFEKAQLDLYRGPVGLSAGVGVDLAARELGADTGFVRATARADYRMQLNAVLNALLPGAPLAEGVPELEHVLGLGARFGYITPLGNERIPFYERFTLGGPRSFRGFAFRRLGPHVEDIPVGGEAYWMGSIEYSFPLVVRNVRLAALFDFGANEPAFSSLAADRMRTAAGLGVLLRLPLLGALVPVNLYWVEALRKEPQDRARVFSFTLDIAF